MPNQVHFQIDGEWFTELALKRFWDDREPYADVHHFIASSLGLPEDDDDTRQLTRDLLERRKRFVGVNSFTLVDCDPVNITPIETRITELEREFAILEIERDMNAHPLDYIDPHSTMMSINVIDAIPTDTYEDLYAYFACGLTGNVFLDRQCEHAYLSHFPAYDTPTKAGLWILEAGPDFVYRMGGARGIHNPQFWENVGHWAAKQPGFSDRTKRWRTSVARERNTDAARERMRASSDWVDGCRAAVRNPFDREYLPAHDESLVKGETTLEPDAGESPFGWCAPDGRWFSCAFAEHEAMAMRIIEHLYPELDFSRAKEFAFDIENLPNWVTNWANDPEYDDTAVLSDLDANRWTQAHDAASFLVEACGWCEIRYLPAMGYYITMPARWNVPGCGHPTSKQKDTIWNVLVKHDIADPVMGLEAFF